MEHLFLTASGKLMNRWVEAFPEASVCSDPEDVSGCAATGKTIIWLDTSAVSTSRLLRVVEELLSDDRPLVAMSATPSQAEALQLLNVGAVGYCHLKAAPAQLNEIAQVVGNRGIWMPPELMQRLLKFSLALVPAETEPPAGLSLLTARELMAAQLVATGASNREIAQQLKITERTVKAHLSAIFEKLEVRDRVQLALTMNNVSTSAARLQLMTED
jgi:DNA-binding NarL/FixJ family response regulator